MKSDKLRMINVILRSIMSLFITNLSFAQRSICAPCQGQQHFHPVEYFGGEKQFEIQQLHDELKREYAKEYLKVPLIEIKYNEVTSIEEMKEFFERNIVPYLKKCA